MQHMVLSERQTQNNGYVQHTKSFTKDKRERAQQAAVTTCSTGIVHDAGCRQTKKTPHRHKLRLTSSSKSLMTVTEAMSWSLMRTTSQAACLGNAHNKAGGEAQHQSALNTTCNSHTFKIIRINVDSTNRRQAQIPKFQAPSVGTTRTFPPRHYTALRTTTLHPQRMQHLLSGMALDLAAHAHAVAHQCVATRRGELRGGHRLRQRPCARGREQRSNTRALVVTIQYSVDDLEARENPSKTFPLYRSSVNYHPR